MNNINDKIKHAAKWSVLTEIIIKILSPITSMILARLLVPEAFGVVATVVMVTTFADVFTDAGFQKYIVQHQFEDDEDENLSICVAFWTNISLSVLLWLFIFLFSEPLAMFVGNPGLGNVIYTGALVLPLTSFSSIQTAIFRKQLNYKKISLARITVKLIPVVVTVPLAVYGYSYWSLIVGNIIGELCNSSLLTYMSNWKPKFLYSFIKLKEMYNFCFWTLCETVSSWFVTNIAIFLIGQTYSGHYLGIYKTGTTMVAQIISLISGATISVLFSSLSRVQNDDQQFEEIYYKFLKIVGMLVIPLGVGICLYSDVVRSILLGKQWSEADLLIGLWGMILAESVIFNDMSGAVVLSKGKPQLLVFSNLLQAIVMSFCVWSALPFDFKYVVIMSCIARVQLPVTQTVMMLRVSKITLPKIWNSVSYYVMATIVMALFIAAIRVYTNTILTLYFSIACSIVVYFSVLLLNNSTRKYIYSLVDSIKK